MIELAAPIPNIGNRLRCDEKEARLFMKNWQEDRRLMIEKLLWASSEDWLSRRQDVIVSRVNAAFESAMKGKFQTSQPPAQPDQTIERLRQAGYSEEQIERIKNWKPQ